MFEFRDFDRAPSLGGSDQRTEHQLQDRSLAERIRDDFETTAFLDQEAFKQVRRPDGPPMRHRESQVGDAGFEVVHEARDRTVVLALVVGNDAGREFARDGPARRLIGRLRADLEVRPDILRHLGRQVAHAMRQATLPTAVYPTASPTVSSIQNLAQTVSSVTVTFSNYESGGLTASSVNAFFAPLSPGRGEQLVSEC